jgi:hypothetical protein
MVILMHKYISIIILSSNKYGTQTNPMNLSIFHQKSEMFLSIYCSTSNYFSFSALLKELKTCMKNKNHEKQRKRMRGMGFEPKNSYETRPST